MGEKIVPTIAVILLNEESVLLIRHGENAKQQTGVYSLPGGVVESGETHVQAAVRELLEETSLQANPADLIEIPKFYSARIVRKNETKVYSMKAFFCQRWVGKKVKGVAGETYPEWVKIADLNSIPLLPNILDAVGEAQRLFKHAA